MPTPAERGREQRWVGAPVPSACERARLRASACAAHTRAVASTAAAHDAESPLLLPLASPLLLPLASPRRPFLLALPTPHASGSGPPPPSSPGRRSPSGCRAAGATLDGARRAPSRSTRAASRGGSGCCHRLGRSGSTLMLQSAAPMIDAAGERTRATDVSAARGLASATCRWAREHRSRAEPRAETGPGANVISGS